jgi:isopentenyl-diphosphate delta-isomerase
VGVVATRELLVSAPASMPRRVAPDDAERVILVDAEDAPLGVASKLHAHRVGALHRAFSVFLLDARDRVLMQRRAPGKYHSAGLWSNTCCGHPRPGERTSAAAARRLTEEMGVSPPPLARVGVVRYRARLSNRLIEHEVDHVYVGRFDGVPDPDPAEADAWRWDPLHALVRDQRAHPGRYSAWLPFALPLVCAHAGDAGR